MGESYGHLGSSQNSQNKYVTILRRISGQECEPHFVLVEHSYTKTWDGHDDSSKNHPRKTLFLRKATQMESDTIDVENVTKNRGSLPYDESRGRHLMKECERHVDFAKLCRVPSLPPAETAHDDDHTEQPDWEHSINKTAWTSTQNQLFSQVVEILDSDQLGRLALKATANEPVRRRALVDKTAAKFRLALSKVHWETRLVGWLHTTLVQHLNDDYIASYLDILQTLKSKIPVLIDRMLQAGSQKGQNVEALNLLLKRPWDPAARSLNSNKPARLEGSPIILQVPDGVGQGQTAVTRRKRFFNSQLQHLAQFVQLSVSTESRCGCHVMDEFRSEVISRVRECRAENPASPIVLLGWGFGALTSCSVSLVEKVSALVCLGLPMADCSGNGDEGENYNFLLDVNTPTLFVVGDRMTNNTIDDVEDLRYNMAGESSMVVVSGADSSLCLSAEKRIQEGLTQSMVDRCVVDEVEAFLRRVLRADRKPELSLRVGGSSSASSRGGKSASSGSTRPDPSSSGSAQHPASTKGPRKDPAAISGKKRKTRNVADTSTITAMSAKSKDIKGVDGLSVDPCDSGTAGNANQVFSKPHPTDSDAEFGTSTFTTLTSNCSGMESGSVIGSAGKIPNVSSITLGSIASLTRQKHIKMMELSDPGAELCDPWALTSKASSSANDIVDVVGIDADFCGGSVVVDASGAVEYTSNEISSGSALLSGSATEFSDLCYVANKAMKPSRRGRPPGRPKGSTNLKSKGKVGKLRHNQLERIGIDSSGNPIPALNRGNSSIRIYSSGSPGLSSSKKLPTKASAEIAVETNLASDLSYSKLLDEMSQTTSNFNQTSETQSNFTILNDSDFDDCSTADYIETVSSNGSISGQILNIHGISASRATSNYSKGVNLTISNISSHVEPTNKGSSSSKQNANAPLSLNWEVAEINEANEIQLEELVSSTMIDKRQIQDNLVDSAIPHGPDNGATPLFTPISKIVPVTKTHQNAKTVILEKVSPSNKICASVYKPNITFISTKDLSKTVSSTANEKRSASLQSKNVVKVPLDLSNIRLIKSVSRFPSTTQISSKGDTNLRTKITPIALNSDFGKTIPLKRKASMDAASASNVTTKRARTISNDETEYLDVESIDEHIVPDAILRPDSGKTLKENAEDDIQRLTFSSDKHEPKSANTKGADTYIQIIQESFDKSDTNFDTPSLKISPTSKINQNTNPNFNVSSVTTKLPNESTLRLGTGREKQNDHISKGDSKLNISSSYSLAAAKSMPKKSRITDSRSSSKSEESEGLKIVRIGSISSDLFDTDFEDEKIFPKNLKTKTSSDAKTEKSQTSKDNVVYLSPKNKKISEFEDQKVSEGKSEKSNLSKAKKVELFVKELKPISPSTKFEMNKDAKMSKQYTENLESNKEFLFESSSELKKQHKSVKSLVEPEKNQITTIRKSMPLSSTLSSVDKQDCLDHMSTDKSVLDSKTEIIKDSQPLDSVAQPEKNHNKAIKLTISSSSSEINRENFNDKQDSIDLSRSTEKSVSHSSTEIKNKLQPINLIEEPVKNQDVTNANYEKTTKDNKPQASKPRDRKSTVDKQETKYPISSTDNSVTEDSPELKKQPHPIISMAEPEKTKISTFRISTSSSSTIRDNKISTDKHDNEDINTSKDKDVSEYEIQLKNHSQNVKSMSQPEKIQKATNKQSTPSSSNIKRDRKNSTERRDTKDLHRHADKFVSARSSEVASRSEPANSTAEHEKCKKIRNINHQNTKKDNTATASAQRHRKKSTEKQETKDQTRSVDKPVTESSTELKKRSQTNNTITESEKNQNITSKRSITPSSSVQRERRNSIDKKAQPQFVHSMAEHEKNKATMTKTCSTPTSSPAQRDRKKSIERRKLTERDTPGSRDSSDQDEEQGDSSNRLTRAAAKTKSKEQTRQLRSSQ